MSKPAALLPGASEQPEGGFGHELVPLEEHELLVFWVQLLVLIACAHVLGALMRRIGLPSVIGQLLAGLVLGPSVFGKVWQDGFEWFLPAETAAVQSAALLAIAWVGVALLLVVTGFETDLDLIRKLGKPAALVTAGSLFVPFVAGIVVGYLMPAQFVGEGTDRTVFALFVALALSVSSLAVVAKILSEMGLMRRDFGQITVAAGMANDVVGWMLLGVFTGLAGSSATDGGEESGALDVVITVVGMLVFVVLALTVGQRLVDWILRRLRSKDADSIGALTVAVLCMLAFGVVTQYLGVEAVLGAFVAGIILHRSRFQNDQVLHLVEGLTFTFFAPVFFATAGLRLDLTALNSGIVLAWTGILILAAIVFKFIGAYAGARRAKMTHRAGLALGAGLNARGALEIVIGTVALTLGVFNATSFTAIVLVPVVTSVFASVGLRWVMRDFEGSATELARLEREEALSRNLVVRNSRMLVSSHAHAASIAAAQVVQFAWPEEAGATVISSDNAVDLVPFENVFYGRDFEHRVHGGDDPALAILAEAKLGFGVVVLGADEPADGEVISKVVDDVLSQSPVPVVVVRRARNLDRPLPGAFTRALVPVARSQSSRAAQEVAFNLSSNLGTEIQLAHVVAEEPASILPRWFGRPSVEPEAAAGDDVAERLLNQASDLAAELGVKTTKNTMSGVNAGREINDFAMANEVDLIIVGSNLRRLDGHPSLGPTVEWVLSNSDATVVVVVVPLDL